MHPVKTCLERRKDFGTSLDMVLSEEERQAIEENKQQQTMTRRVTVAAAEEALYTPIPVLDHGFVRLVDYMGDDGAVVQAARVSYGRGTQKVRDDRGLIRYLMRHQHTTPFEMCEIKFHVKLPIFVARQWVRHRSANINEISGRYSILDKEFYLPSPEHVGVQSSSNRQGRAEPLSADQTRFVLDTLREDAERCYAHYEAFLLEEKESHPSHHQPLARELARMNLTLNTYTQWYWKIDLHNLFHFLRLRMDSHAQYEIRVYAEAMAQLVQKWVPLCWEAFEDYRLNRVEFSRAEHVALRALLQGEAPDLGALGLSKREQDEFWCKVGRS